MRRHGSLRSNDYSLQSESMCGGQALLLHRDSFGRRSVCKEMGKRTDRRRSNRSGTGRRGNGRKKKSEDKIGGKLK